MRRRAAVRRRGERSERFSLDDFDESGEEGGADDSEISLDKPDTEKAARIIQSRFRERKRKEKARRGK